MQPEPCFIGLSARCRASLTDTAPGRARVRTACPWHRCAWHGAPVAPVYGRFRLQPSPWEVVPTAGTDEESERSERLELEQLAERARRSEEEVAALRRRLSEGPGRVQTLEERLLETKGQLSQAVSQNEKLTFTLQQAKEHIAALREEVDKLTQPPCAYGTFMAANDDRTVDVFSGGRKMRVAVHPEIEVEEMRRGEEVVLNESLSVILHRKGDESGEIVTLKEVLEGGRRAIVYGRADEERVVELADSLARSEGSGG